jgi:cysteine synthase A
MAVDEISRIIGATPLIELERFSEEVGVRVYVKYEAANPGASIKDRAARTMIDEAEAAGIIIPGKSTLIEPTSGNTGIGIAMIGAARGYQVVLVMPESMSRERRMLAAAYGARLVLTPASQGMRGAVDQADELERSIDGGWIVGQFANPNNPLAHERTTGPEIREQLGFDPAYVVAGVGTGGTISGCAHYFQKTGAATRFYAVEPAESPIIGQTLAGRDITPGPHGIQGIGANFIPDALDLEVLAGALPVRTADAIKYARAAAAQGLLVGISSGANLAGVRQLVRQHPDVKGQVVVTFAVDTGERYLSTPLFDGVA